MGADMYSIFWDWLCSGGLRSNSLEQKKVYSHSDSQSQSPSRSTVIHELSTCIMYVILDQSHRLFTLSCALFLNFDLILILYLCVVALL